MPSKTFIDTIVEINKIGHTLLFFVPQFSLLHDGDNLSSLKRKNGHSYRQVIVTSQLNLMLHFVICFMEFPTNGNKKQGKPSFHYPLNCRLHMYVSERTFLCIVLFCSVSLHFTTTVWLLKNLVRKITF